LCTYAQKLKLKTGIYCCRKTF